MDNTPDWREEFDRKFEFWNDTTTGLKGAVKSFIESELTALKQTHTALVLEEHRLTREATIKECKRVINDYFEGLMVIPFPQLTKKAILQALSDMTINK